jgi:tripartite-type tricarboxylate transporter receptor subunit TctC
MTRLYRAVLEIARVFASASACAQYPTRPIRTNVPLAAGGPLDSVARVRRQRQVFGNTAGTAVVGVLAVAFSALVAPAGVLAQGYPAKPLRIIVPLAAGGPPDFVARTVAQHLTAGLGQQVIVENRPGAGGTIATAAAAKSPGDGYTLLLASTTTFSISPSLYANPGYDPGTSFAPISLLATAPFLIVVHPSLPARSLKELIALARSKPGELNFGSGGNGSPLHIAGEMLKTAAGVQLVHVPYKGVATAVMDLLSGRVQVMVDQLFPVAQYIQNGKIRPLAVASTKRHPQLPNLPTTAEAGLPGYEVSGWMGLVAPRGTPADVVKRLNLELVKALQTKEVRDGLFNQGLQPASNSPEEFAAFIAAESVKWSHAVKASGAKVD